jgi:hypothetical protein
LWGWWYDKFFALFGEKSKCMSEVHSLLKFVELIQGVGFGQKILYRGQAD